MNFNISDMVYKYCKNKNTVKYCCGCQRFFSRGEDDVSSQSQEKITDSHFWIFLGI